MQLKRNARSAVYRFYNQSYGYFALKKEYRFSADELEASLKTFSQKGITELFVNDEAMSNDKKRLIRFLSAVESDAGDLFVSIKVNPNVIDGAVCKKCAEVNCSLEIPLVVEKKGAAFLFDKKNYAKKCTSLNTFELVFGFQIFYADFAGDTLKSFCERLDFAVSQFPNHIDFPQTEEGAFSTNAYTSGVFSGGDIRFARNIAFACRTFYSSGRAVTWFNSVLRPLRIKPSKFFTDFAEWQRVNNCDFKSGFSPEDSTHREIEKMQLLFLQMKYEEKGVSALFPVVKDIVRINGALSRLVSDGEECELALQYSPDDLFGPESMDVERFANDVCMESSHVRIFDNGGEPDYMVK